MTSNNLDHLYRSVIMDHYNHPRNYGTLEDQECITVSMNSPSCGDKIHISLKFADDKIVDVKYNGSGCAISRSSASMMTELIKGMSINQVQELSVDFSKMIKGDPHNDDLKDAEVFTGISDYPARIGCVTFPWKAMEKALLSASEKSRVSLSTYMK